MEEQKYEIEDLQMDVEHKNMLKNLIIDKEKEADSYVVQGLNILMVSTQLILKNSGLWDFFLIKFLLYLKQFLFYCMIQILK